MDMDFGYGQNNNSNNTTPDPQNGEQNSATNLSTGKEDNDNNGNPVSILDDESVDDDSSQKKNSSTTNEEGDSNKSTTAGNLEAGTTIEADGKTYTIDEKGNLLDENGGIYKEASEVQNWIDSFEQVDEGLQGEISISSIQEAIGVDITDDDNNPVTYNNTPEGIKAYVDDVIETAKNEHYETAINTLYERYPIVKDVLDYYIANGNSMEGYGELPDRSGIEVDDSNEAQQEAIIRVAWDEQGRRGDVESYIEYLKSSGTLFATAQEELEGLKEADAQRKQYLEEEAERKEDERIAQLAEYWDGVKSVIDTRQIAGYQIPENIIINRNGQKISVTPNDFYNYLYRVDDNGMSAYARDLAAETLESRRDDEILRAFLKFTGGSYSNLVNMEINKQQVANLKLRAKERSANSIRINKPANKTPNGVNVDLGYN